MNPHPSVDIDVDHYHTCATDLHGMPNPMIGKTPEKAVHLPQSFKTLRFSGPILEIIAVRASDPPLLDCNAQHPGSSLASLIVKPVLIPDTGAC